MAKQCVTCGGIYEPIGTDGIVYAHVCPPIHAVKVRRADGAIVILPADQVAKDDAVIGEITLERKGARNENPDTSRKAVDGAHPIMSEGDGVVELVDVEPILVGLPDAVQPRTDPAA